MTIQAAATHSDLARHHGSPALGPRRPQGVQDLLLVLGGWIIGGSLGMILLTRVLGAKTPRLSWNRRSHRLDRPLCRGVGWPWRSPHGSRARLAHRPPLGAVRSRQPARVRRRHVHRRAHLFARHRRHRRAIVTFVILRNPTSGGSVPNQMLPGGFRFLADVLANSAGVSLVRGIEFYGGSGLGRGAVYSSARVESRPRSASPGVPAQPHNRGQRSHRARPGSGRRDDAPDDPYLPRPRLTMASRPPRDHPHHEPVSSHYRSDRSTQISPRRGPPPRGRGPSRPSCSCGHALRSVASVASSWKSSDRR